MADFGKKIQDSQIQDWSFDLMNSIKIKFWLLPCAFTNFMQKMHAVRMNKKFNFISNLFHTKMANWSILQATFSVEPVPLSILGFAQFYSTQYISTIINAYSVLEFQIWWLKISQLLKNLTIFNIIRWVNRLIDQGSEWSKYYFNRLNWIGLSPFKTLFIFVKL